MSVDLFVLGCSHAGRLIKGAQVIGLIAAGGALMRGRLWDEGRFAVSDADGLAPHDAVASARLKAGLAEAGVARLTDLKVPIVTTLGFQFDPLLDELAERYTLVADPSDARDFLTRDAFDAFVLERRAALLGVIGWLVSLGGDVMLVSPPPRHFATEFAAAFEAVVIGAAAKLGARTHLTRDWSTDAQGGLRDQFAAQKEGDRVHGNTYFGACAMHRVAGLLGLTPMIAPAVLADPAAFDAHMARLQHEQRRPAIA